MLLKERTAIVTGSSRGIGRGIAQKLAEEGASVVINGTTGDKVDETVELIKKQGGAAIGVVADITKKNEVENLIDKTIEEFGKVEILVNNAGNHHDSMLVDMTEQQWDEVIDVHLKGTFLCTQAAAKNMRQNKYGRIISISSEGGFFGNIGMVNYITSKAGLFGFTLAAAKEFALWVRKEGCDITCNCVTPGYNETRITRAVPKKIDKIFREATLMDRIADSKEDIGGIVAFLASKESSYITGALIAAGGGRHLEDPRII
ncbi:SDR family NAD(P)-dependent oxidoreductase [Thermodesulfobacteriota bacterium]